MLASKSSNAIQRKKVIKARKIVTKGGKKLVKARIIRTEVIPRNVSLKKGFLNQKGRRNLSRNLQEITSLFLNCKLVGNADCDLNNVIKLSNSG